MKTGCHNYLRCRQVYGDMIEALQYAIRNLQKQPGFSLVVILTLGLAIGGTTSVFSVVEAMLIRSLPYRDADRLVMIWNRYGKMTFNRAHNSPPDYLDRKRESRTLENIAAIEETSVNLIGRGEPQRVRTARVSASLLPTLGVSPFIGRNFRVEEDQPGRNSVVILSYRYWQKQFAADTSLIGRALNLSGNQYTVIGIMPQNFWFPQPETDMWIPIAFTADQTADSFRGNEYLAVIGRIKRGIDLSKVTTEMNVIAQGVLTRVPERSEFLSNAGWGAIVVPLRESLIGDTRPALLTLMTAVGFVLMIGCANVINLFLARAGSRQKEMAIRAALGAKRSSLILLLITESALLASIGGTLGLLLAYWSTRILPALAPENVTRISMPQINSSVLGFSFLVSILCGVVTGIIPALRASTLQPSESLKIEGTSSPARSHHLLRNGLVVAEVALALVLLTGAGLLMKSFMKLNSVSPGFQTDNRLSFTLSLPRSQYKEDSQVAEFYRTFLRRIQSLPTVRSAGANASMPIAGENWTATFVIQDRPLRQGEPEHGFEYRMVTPDYFRAMGVPLKYGRDFNESDTQDSTRVAIVDENLARRFWPNESALGRRIGFSNSSGTIRWRQIIGVVGHVKNAGLTAESMEQVYLPHAQLPQEMMTVIIHSASDPAALIAAIRRIVKSLDSKIPIYQITLLSQMLRRSIAQPRFNMIVLVIFALSALMLATIGIYGVISYSVTQRKKEIGIRMALGAERDYVLAMIIRQSLTLAGSGIVAGLTSSLILSRFLQTLLFRTQPIDPMLYAVTAGMALIVALLASSIPASRAASVDPLQAWIRCGCCARSNRQSPVSYA